MRKAKVCLIAACLTGSILNPLMGQGWEIVPSPNPGNYLNNLYSASVLSADDAWAAGRYQNASGLLLPLAMRWDGEEWNVVALPGTDSIGTMLQLAGVATTPEGDTWFGGRVSLGGNFNRVVVCRHSGNTWDYVRGLTLNSQGIYPYGHRNGFPADIDATSADNVWIVGGADGTGAGATAVVLILRWNGSDWIEYNPPEVATRSHWLYAVDAVSDTDVWAVGYYRNWSGLYRGLIFHWDGTSWTHRVHPWESSGFATEFQEVKAFAPDDVWIFGGPQYLHWNGTQWETVAPAPGSYGVYTADGPSADDLWAVSSYSGVFYHFNGSQWSIADTVQVPGSTEFFPGRYLAAATGGTVWTVGNYVQSGVTRTFTARRQSALPPVSDLTIAVNGSLLTLRWSTVAGADIYDLYEIVSDTPALVATTTGASHTMPIPDGLRREYYVIARQAP